MTSSLLSSCTLDESRATLPSLGYTEEDVQSQLWPWCTRIQEWPLPDPLPSKVDSNYKQHLVHVLPPSPSYRLPQKNNTLVPVLLSLYWRHLIVLLLRFRKFFDDPLLLVDGCLLVHGRAAVPGNAAGQQVVSWRMRLSRHLPLTETHRDCQPSKDVPDCYVLYSTTLVRAESKKGGVRACATFDADEETMVSLSERTWQDLDPPLSSECISGISRLGFKFMTPVQVILALSGPR